MSAAGPTVTVTFGANAAQLYAAYAAFQAYVRANPVNVGWGGGPAGGGAGGAGGSTYITNNITNNIYGTGAGGGPGGGGTGGGGRAGAGGLPLGRGITIFGLFHAASQIEQNEERYADEMRAALGDNLKFAEAGLHHRKSYDSMFGGIGRLGRGIRDIDPFGEETTTEQLQQSVLAAQLAERKTEMVREGMAINRTAGYRQAEAEAGPAGSAQQQRQAIEDRYKAEFDRIRELKAERLKAIEEEKNAAIEAGNTAAEFNARDSQKALKHTFDPAEASAEAVRKRQLADLEYNQQQQALRARQAADIAKLEYEHKPQVADVRDLYNAGIDAAARAQHAGNTPEAKADLEAAQFRLMHMREMLQLGEGGGFEENAGQIDFSGTDNSIRLGGGGRGYDDTADAIKESNDLLRSIEQLLRNL